MDIKRLLPWFAALGVITILFGTVYAAVQQSLRESLNDPQIQLAEDTASNLDKGTSPSAATANPVDIDHSLAPFVIVYDKKGHVVAGNGYLNSQVPVVPSGVLSASSGRPYNAVTWQPQTDVRIASVTVASKDYYVLSGRNMREVEHREDAIFQLASFGWFISVATVVGAWLVLARFT